MNLTNYYRLKIKESKFPNMLPENRFWGENMGITPECLESGMADEPLAELDLTREDVEVVKDQSLINKMCKQYLAETDWYVSRFGETGKAIPEDILHKRQEARDSIIEEEE